MRLELAIPQEDFSADHLSHWFCSAEIIEQKLNLPKPYPADTLATAYCTKLQS